MAKVFKDGKVVRTVTQSQREREKEERKRRRKQKRLREIGRAREQLQKSLREKAEAEAKEAKKQEAKAQAIRDLPKTEQVASEKTRRILLEKKRLEEKEVKKQKAKAQAIRDLPVTSQFASKTTREIVQSDLERIQDERAREEFKRASESGDFIMFASEETRKKVAKEQLRRRKESDAFKEIVSEFRQTAIKKQRGITQTPTTQERELEIALGELKSEFIEEIESKREGTQERRAALIFETDKGEKGTKRGLETSFKISDITTQKPQKNQFLQLFEQDIQQAREKETLAAIQGKKSQELFFRGQRLLGEAAATITAAPGAIEGKLKGRIQSDFEASISAQEKQLISIREFTQRARETDQKNKIVAGTVAGAGVAGFTEVSKFTQGFIEPFTEPKTAASAFIGGRVLGAGFKFLKGKGEKVISTARTKFFARTIPKGTILGLAGVGGITATAEILTTPKGQRSEKAGRITGETVIIGKGFTRTPKTQAVTEGELKKTLSAFEKIQAEQAETLAKRRIKKQQIARGEDPSTGKVSPIEFSNVLKETTEEIGKQAFLSAKVGKTRVTRLQNIETGETIFQLSNADTVKTVAVKPSFVLKKVFSDTGKTVLKKQPTFLIRSGDETKVIPDPTKIKLILTGERRGKTQIESFDVPGQRIDLLKTDVEQFQVFEVTRGLKRKRVKRTVTFERFERTSAKEFAEFDEQLKFTISEKGIQDIAAFRTLSPKSNIEFLRGGKFEGPKEFTTTLDDLIFTTRSPRIEAEQVTAIRNLQRTTKTEEVSRRVVLKEVVGRNIAELGQFAQISREIFGFRIKRGLPFAGKKGAVFGGTGQKSILEPPKIERFQDFARTRGRTKIKINEPTRNINRNLLRVNQGLSLITGARAGVLPLSIVDSTNILTTEQETRQRQPLRINLSSTVRQRQTQRSILNILGQTRTRQVLKVSLGTQTTQAVGQALRTRPTTRTSQQITPSFTIQTGGGGRDTPPPPPIITELPRFDIDIQERKDKKTKRKKQTSPIGFTPSLIAITGQIFGKRRGRTTGLEFRPLIRR